MLALLVCLYTPLAYNLDDILLVYSDHTPLGLVQHFPNYSKRIYVSSQVTVNSSFCEEQVSIIVDLTLKSCYLTILEDLAEYCSSIYLTITPTSLKTKSQYRFFVHGSLELETEALIQIKSFLNNENFCFIVSNSMNDLQILKNLEKADDQEYSSIVYDPQFLLNNIKLNVKRFIKTKGLKKVVILGEGPSLQTVQDELFSQNLIVYGNYFLIGSRGIYSASIEGALVLAEPGTESATSYEDFEFLSILEIVKKIIKHSKNINAVNEICPNHRCTTSYNIVNIQNSVKKIVGSFAGTLNFTESIVYPGNNKDSNLNTTKTKLLISLANGTSEIYNQGNVPYFAYRYQGANYALQLSNMKEEIKGFEFEFFPTNCGNFMYDPTWYNICFSQIADKLGLVYLTSIWYTGAQGNLLTLRNLQKFIPQISPEAFDTSLESKQEFPEFLKNTLSYKDTFLASFSLFQINCWRNVIVFSSDDDAYKRMYQDVLKFMKIFNIKVLNPEEKQVFPANYTRDQFEQYRDYFEAAKNTKCRVYYILTSVTRFIIEGLYDIGLNKEDVIIIGETTLIDLLNSDKENPYNYKIKGYLLNSVIIRAIEFSGDYGLQIESQMSQIFPSTYKLGFSFDAFIAVKESLKLMIEKGEDYEDKHKLMSYMRNIKTTGVGGALSFDPDTNNRANTKFIFYQIIKNDTTGEYEHVDKILIDKYGVNSYILIDRFVWPDGSTQIPSDMILEGDCSFRDFQVQESDKGLRVLYIVCSFVFILVFIIAIISCKFLKTDYIELNEAKKMSLSDYGSYFYFYFEFFQIVSMGPDQRGFKKLLNRFEVLLSLEFSLYYKFQRDDFWHLYSATVVLALLFVISTFVILSRLLLDKYPFARVFVFISEMIFIISHFMYLPLISILMNIYSCRESIGNELESSYLVNDCTTFCYKGNHMKWAIGSGCLLVSILTLITYFRPHYETLQVSLHIRTKPVYIHITSIFQVLLIVINKCLKEINQSTAGFIQAGIILAFLVLTVYMKPYNYSKAAISQITSLTMAAYAVLISAIFIRTSNLIVWIIVEFIGLFLIITFGFIVVKNKASMLHEEKAPITIEDLFKFQLFGKNKILYNLSMHSQKP